MESFSVLIIKDVNIGKIWRELDCEILSLADFLFG